jgi:head-tail adaptor
MAAQIHSGSLDRQVTIERATVTREPTFGAQVRTWAAIATEWAQVVESSVEPGGNPGQAASMAAYNRPTRVRIRWRGDITTRDRVRHGARLLQITGVAEVGRAQWLEMACQEWAHEQ